MLMGCFNEFPITFSKREGLKFAFCDFWFEQYVAH